MRGYTRGFFNVPQRGGGIKTLHNPPSTPVLLPGGEVRHMTGGSLDLFNKANALKERAQSYAVNKIADHVSTEAVKNIPGPAKSFVKAPIKTQIATTLDTKIDGELERLVRPGQNLKNKLVRKIERDIKKKRGDLAKITRSKQFSEIPHEQALASLMYLANKSGIPYKSIPYHVRKFTDPGNVGHTAYEILRKLRN